MAQAVLKAQRFAYHDELTGLPIRAHLATPYHIDGAEITMTTSLGIAMHPVDAHAFRDLLRESDLAMYCNKARRPAAPNIVGSPLG